MDVNATEEIHGIEFEENDMFDDVRMTFHLQNNDVSLSVTLEQLQHLRDRIDRQIIKMVNDGTT